MNNGMLKELQQYCGALDLLFVEDDTSIQKSIADSLGEFFNKIYIANNGQEGLDKYASDEWYRDDKKNKRDKSKPIYHST
jgi:hypothetical protein